MNYGIIRLSSRDEHQFWEHLENQNYLEELRRKEKIRILKALARRRRNANAVFHMGKLP